MKRFRRLLLMLPVLAAVSCIRNDIPYPVVVLEILGVAGEGFTCEASDIDTKNNIVTLHLAETTDISRVRIDSIALTEGSPCRASLTCGPTCPWCCRSIRITNGRCGPNRR